MAVANYHDASGCYPPAYIADADGRSMHSWRVLLLPYLDAGDVYEQYDFSEPWDGPNNRTLADRMPPIYALHGEHRPGLGVTNYLAVVGAETAWPGETTISSADVSDGLSTTVLVVENVGANVYWMEPRDLPLARMSLKINRSDGVSSVYTNPAVVMLDGSVHKLDAELTPAVLRALLTAQGGESVLQETRGWSLLSDGRERERADRAER